MIKTYQPRGDAEAVLNAAMAHINTVGYKVGLRWVMYRLLQDGAIPSKDDYPRLKSLASKARKGFWGGWHPETLVDEGRHISPSAKPISADDMLALLPYYVRLKPDLFSGQPAVPFLIYEAATMDGQFEHFAPWADRAAFRGDASIPHKWNIAKRCDELAERYKLPVHVLYFGDYDPKGLVIPKSAMGDIAAWVKPGTELMFTRVGINEGHAERFGIPEKLEKPGTYEWEALSSEDAGSLINEALAMAVDVAEIRRRTDAAAGETEALRDFVSEALEAAQ